MSMDRLPGKRFLAGAVKCHILASATLILAHLVSDGHAVPSFLLDAEQIPKLLDEKTGLSSATGCARLVGCASATGAPGDAPPQPPPAEAKNAAAAVAKPAIPPPPAHAQPPAPNNTESNQINKPSKKSHPGDPTLVQPASQYHYYGGNTEERRRRNVHFYPAPMKRKYATYSRLKRNVRLSPKEMLALLSLWERPLSIEDNTPVIPTQSSNRRYFKHQDTDRELMLDEEEDDVDDDDDGNEYGIERSRDPWGESRETSRRYFPQEPYRNEKRTWQRQRALEEQQQHLEAKKRFQRLVEKQLAELRREREEPRGTYETANLAAEWGPHLDYKPEYKRRSSLGTARYKPEDAKLYRWLQLQGQ